MQFKMLTDASSEIKLTACIKTGAKQREMVGEKECDL
jgi:hypothetical protein